MAAGRTEVLGADELRKALKAAPRTMKSALRASAKTVAKQAEGHARAAAAGGTRQQARARNAITGTGSTTAATLKIGPTTKAPFARGAFWGSKEFKQFPEWVGNTWKVATKGQGPYRINDALAEHQGDYETDFLAGQVNAIGPPFH